MEEVLAEAASWKAAVVVTWLAAIFIAERALPAAREPETEPGEVAGGSPRVARNGALWLVNVGLSPAIVLPLSYWASDQRIDWRPDLLAGWPGLLIDLILLDFLIYWWHRANHQWRFLWRFHEVHHLDRFLDSTSALRFHFGEVLLSALARAGVILLLDIPLTSILLFEGLLLVATIFHHSNLRLPKALERRLGRLIITPALHWVHHHARQSDTDSNYGTLFSFWDLLFKTRSATRRRLDMRIGVEKRQELKLPSLLLQPFTVRPDRLSAGSD